MSPEDNTQQTPAAPNMRGRWRRPAARTTGQPAPQQPASFGAVEDIQTVKESLSGSQSNVKAEPVAEKAPVETVSAPAESAPVLVCCLEKETVNGETAEAPVPAEASAPAEAVESCGCSCACAQEEAPTAPAAEVPSETAPAAEASAPAAEAAAETLDEAELLKTNWRDERKRYVGLRPDPVDRHPERVRSRPYEDRPERAERTERSERSERPERPERFERSERGPRPERFEQRPQRSERLNTEVASTPRVSEYTPSRERSSASVSAKPAPKQGLLSKVLRFLGIGKSAEKPAQRPHQGSGERSSSGAPAFRGPRQGGERYGNRPYRNDRDGRDGREAREGDSQGGERNYRHGRRRRRSGGQGGQGGDYRRSQGPQGNSNA